MISLEPNLLLERQLLLQLGERLRRARQAQGIGTADMAARVGVSRNTLRAVETGDPATAIGTYVRVMSVLGMGGELALLAADHLTPPAPGTAAARSRRSAPVVQVTVTAPGHGHSLQDVQSLVLHEEAVRRAKADPALVQQARATVLRWLEQGQARSAPLWREWLRLLDAGDWRRILGRSQRAQQLRQASPLVTVLPQEVRQGLLAQAAQLRGSITLGAPGETTREAAAQEWS